MYTTLYKKKLFCVEFCNTPPRPKLRAFLTGRPGPFFDADVAGRTVCMCTVCRCRQLASHAIRPRLTMCRVQSAGPAQVIAVCKDFVFAHGPAVVVLSAPDQL